ncbi:MAG: sugar-binding domain-containing protein, partial [Bacteroidota bacterium]
MSSRKWKVEGTLPGEGVKKMFHKYLPDAGPATVPGDVYTDLWRLGRIDDPHMGTNSQKAKWVMDYEWWYFRLFDLPKEMEGKEIRVYFEGVDYACDVYLNGEFLGSHEGMLSHFSFPITDLVRFTTAREPKDNNFLAIRLHPAPRTLALVNGRKYRWHGDYNQNVTPTGIWRPVKLVATGSSRITDLYTHAKLEKDGSALVEVELEVTNDEFVPKQIEAEVSLKGKNFEAPPHRVVIQETLKPGLNRLQLSIPVKDPKLWWPWDMGNQHLYLADAVLRAEGEVQDVEQVTFGIREVKMEMNPGWTEEEVELPWTVMINGKRHFLRSGTWGGPPDIFTGSTTEEVYRDLIRLAKEANINNLRIFNWHPPEIPLFYELCDEAGISVWQDIVPINNPILHLGEEYKQAIFDEAIASLKQRRNHPCNVIIEGSEEILFMSSQSAREYQLSVVEELGEVLKAYTDLHYIPTSPLSSHHATSVGFKHHESAHPHGVHYGMGNFFMEDYYPKQNYAAIPELAVTSCPNVESIKRFIPEDEIWPPGPSWGY